MATVLLGEKKGSRRANYSNRGSKFVYEETLTYIVESDVYNESPITVLLTSGLPTVLVSTITGTGGYCICTGLNPTQNNLNGKIWEVEATFTTDIEGQDVEAGDPEDPTTWVPRYRGKFEFYNEVLYKDRSSTPKPYVNSAGDKFPEPLISRKPIVVYEFWQIEPNTVTDLDIGNRNDKINSATFRSAFAAKTLKLTVSGFERGWFYGADAVKIDYQLAYNPDGWLNKPIDAGYGYLVSAGGAKVPSDTLVYLNTDGTKKADGATPSFLEFEPFEAISFSFLR